MRPSENVVPPLHEPRAQLRWTLVAELFFFAAVLAVATTVARSPALLASAAMQRFLRELDQAFVPLASVRPWYRLGLAIFLHNLRAFLLVALAASVCAALAAQPRLRSIAAAALILAVAGSAFFWAANVFTAGAVVGVVASETGVEPLVVWTTLLPHGVFELFALSWAMVLSWRLAWTWLALGSAEAAAADLLRAIWPTIVGIVAILALAALIESTVSPRVLHALVPTAGHSLVRSAAPR